ncbi:hypothetical protein VVR46_06955 [Corynebacterium phoceense]|uniref:hypothetical protein n=1 Tax=Corynebacterium phoceense TaxID=1686286 RepID=UPI0034D0191B
MTLKRSTFVAVSAAAVLSLAGTGVASAAPALPAGSSLPTVEQLSSQVPRVELPNEAYDLADQFGVQLPEFLARPGVSNAELNRVSTDVTAATAAHLRKQGHKDDTNAQKIAQEWANQGKAGIVKFDGNAGDGTTHLNEGSGNVYKLTLQEAKDRLAWLQRDVPVQKSPNAKPFGVASATDGEFVYLAEYFFN